MRTGGSTFTVDACGSKAVFDTQLAGKFNVYNILSAVGAATVYGIDIATCAAAIDGVTCIDGRNQTVVTDDGVRIVVDFAHTPDGLKTTLNSMRRICEGKLYCLFGCGGNREKEKRSVMGEISGVIADFTIITSDNPRYEDPCLIISEIEKGIRRVTRNYVTVSDRKSALVYAISLLKDGDVLVVAGKGAESYQEIMGVKRDFSDEAEIRSAIARIEGENS